MSSKPKVPQKRGSIKATTAPKPEEPATDATTPTVSESKAETSVSETSPAVESSNSASAPESSTPKAPEISTESSGQASEAPSASTPAAEEVKASPAPSATPASSEVKTGIPAETPVAEPEAPAAAAASATQAATPATEATAEVVKEEVPVPPSAMAAPAAVSAAAAASEAKSNAALEAAKTLASNTAFLQRATVYQSAKTEGILALQAWHEKLLNFFAQQRAPYVQKLDTVQLRIRNGDRALSEAKRILTFLAESHASYAKNLGGISLFGVQLDRIPAKPADAGQAATSTAVPAPPPPAGQARPVPPPPGVERRPSTTMNAAGQPVPQSALAAGLVVPTTAMGLGMEIPLPEGATVDPSALSLAVLAGMTFQQADKTRIMADQLKQTITSVTVLQKSYANRAQNDVDTMRDLVQQCEKAAREVDNLFKSHMEIYGYYSRALSPAPPSPASKGQESPAQALTSGSRKDLWLSEQVYRERVVGLTKLHETFFTQCSQLLEDLSAAEQQRALKLHAIISDTIGRYDQYFGALYRTNSVAATEVQQCLIVANRNHAVLKQQQQAQLMSQIGHAGSQESKTPSAPPPGPFPPNVNIVLAGPAERRTSFLKNWTPVYLVLTKDNYLHCYAGEDVDTSVEVDKLLGPQPGLPAGTLVTTSDPRQARLVLKEGRSVESNELWAADLFHCSAVAGEGRAEDESPNKAGLGFMFTLRVSPPGFFSRNWTVVLRCKTPDETQTWLRAINDHSKGLAVDEAKK